MHLWKKIVALSAFAALGAGPLSCKNSSKSGGGGGGNVGDGLVSGIAASSTSPTTVEVTWKLKGDVPKGRVIRVGAQAANTAKKGCDPAVDDADSEGPATISGLMPDTAYRVFVCLFNEKDKKDEGTDLTTKTISVTTQPESDQCATPGDRKVTMSSNSRSSAARLRLSNPSSSMNNVDDTGINSKSLDCATCGADLTWRLNTDMAGCADANACDAAAEGQVTGVSGTGSAKTCKVCTHGVLQAKSGTSCETSCQEGAVKDVQTNNLGVATSCSYCMNNAWVPTNVASQCVSSSAPAVCTLGEVQYTTPATPATSTCRVCLPKSATDPAPAWVENLANSFCKVSTTTVASNTSCGASVGTRTRLGACMVKCLDNTYMDDPAPSRCPALALSGGSCAASTATSMIEKGVCLTCGSATRVWAAEGTVAAGAKSACCVNAGEVVNELGNCAVPQPSTSVPTYLATGLSRYFDAARPGGETADIAAAPSGVPVTWTAVNSATLKAELAGGTFTGTTKTGATAFAYAFPLRDAATPGKISLWTINPFNTAPVGLTFEIWIQPDATVASSASTDPTPILSLESAADAGLVVVSKAGKPYWGAKNGATLDLTNATAWAFPSAAWSQLVVSVTIAGNVAKASLFTNGVLQNGTPVEFTLASASFSAAHIGISNLLTGTVVKFGGKVGLIRVYSQALTTTQVNDNCKVEKDRFGVTCAP